MQQLSHLPINNFRTFLNSVPHQTESIERHVVKLSQQSQRNASAEMADDNESNESYESASEVNVILKYFHCFLKMFLCLNLISFSVVFLPLCLIKLPRTISKKMDEDKTPTNKSDCEANGEELITRREPRLTSEMLARVPAAITDEEIEQEIGVSGEEDWHSVVPKVPLVLKWPFATLQTFLCLLAGVGACDH